MWFLQALLVQLQIKQSVAHFFLGWLQQQLQCYYCRPITTPVLQIWGYFHNRVCVSVELSVSQKYLGYVSIWPNSLIPSFCVTVSSRLTNFGSSAPLDFQTFLVLKSFEYELLMGMNFPYQNVGSCSTYVMEFCVKTSVGRFLELQCWTGTLLMKSAQKLNHGSGTVKKQLLNTSSNSLGRENLNLYWKVQKEAGLYFVYCVPRQGYCV